jgi:NAD(P)-dependent dehydrogenase (short-subunit alcohol dehydrogenase family)
MRGTAARRLDGPAIPWERRDAAVFVVTGAGRGIGLELTAQWLARGERVIATYRDDGGKARLEAAGAGGDLRLVRLDVRDAGSVAALAAALDGTPVEVLVNNAGVMGTSAPSLADVDYDEWLETFVVNVQGPHRVTAALLPNLQAGKRPRVVTLSSIMGCLHRASPGHYAYRSSKAAVNKVMQLLANDLAPLGIVACPVHPGWVQTDMGGAGAELSVGEAAAGLVALIDRLTPEHAGRFWQWNGTELAW